MWPNNAKRTSDANIFLCDKKHLIHMSEEKGKG